MSIRRTLARLGAPLAAAAVVTAVAAAPATAHVTVSPSTATAGDFTVMTVSVPHGCDGSATTRIDVQIPEQVLSVTPTRNPFWTQKTTIAKLDKPVTDEEGNKVTERTGTVVYTAKQPLPDHVRDSFELSFQVPDAAGDTLRFPTVQTCEKGETAWTEIPAAGQDPFELEHPAPFFEIVAASDTGEVSTETVSSETGGSSAATAQEDNSDALSWVALGVGALGLLVGGAALTRSRKTT